MDRCAIFIDAGHLLAEGGKLCCKTKMRANIACDYAAVIAAVAEIATKNCALPILRTYWYDGARDAIPTLDHLAVAALPNVKLRLGRLSGGKQKGVDALIFRDLMVLARERAVATAYLLGGDEDLREGVTAAQDMGVRVVVLGIATDTRNQAATLVREADENIVLGRDLLSPFLTLTSAVTPVAVQAVPPKAVARAAPAPKLTARKAGSNFAEEWVSKATPDDIQRLLGQSPVIPRELDAELVKSCRTALGIVPSPGDPVDQKAVKDIRHGFWAVVRAAK